MVHFSDLALSKGDHLLGRILYSLNEDCQWHRVWSQALVRIAIQDRSTNRDVLQRWVNRWSPLGLRALDALSPALAADSGIDLSEQISSEWHSYLNSMDLDAPSVAKLREDGWPAS
jgi:hypothetical protein